MKSSVLNCMGLGLSLQGFLWGDSCGICGMDHKPGLCPIETLEFRIDEEDVDDWDSDAEEKFVVQQEMNTQLLRNRRNKHHCKTLKYDLYFNETSERVDPLKADKVYQALLERCNSLLAEVKTLCDLVQVLDMGQTCKVCKAAREEQQRLERERLEREEAERRRREEEARKPRGFTGQQIVDRTVQNGTPKKSMMAHQMVHFNRIQPSATYLDLGQLDPFFHKASFL